MKQKVCNKCNKKRLEKFFNKNNSVTCKTCLGEYRREYYREKKETGDYHKPRQYGSKTCSGCQTEKDVNLFPVNILCKGGRTSVCSKCNYQLYKGRKKKQVSYSKSHPKQWNKYYNAYKKNYRADPFANKRMNLAVRVWRMELKPETDICSCGNTGKLLAFLPDKLIYKSLKFKILSEELTQSIVWMCRPCIYAKRKTRE